MLTLVNLQCVCSFAGLQCEYQVALCSKRGACRHTNDCRENHHHGQKRSGDACKRLCKRFKRFAKNVCRVLQFLGTQSKGCCLEQVKMCKS